MILYRSRKAWLFMILIAIIALLTELFISRDVRADDITKDQGVKDEELVNKPNSGETALAYMQRQQNMMRVSELRIQTVRRELKKVEQGSRSDKDFLIKSFHDTIKSNTRLQNQIQQRWLMAWDAYNSEKKLRELNQELYNDWAEHIKWEIQWDIVF